VASVAPIRAEELRAILDRAGVDGLRIGRAGGSALQVRVGTASVAVSVAELGSAWRTPFAS